VNSNLVRNGYVSVHIDHVVIIHCDSLKNVAVHLYHNSGKSWWILIIYLEMGMPSASKLFTYLFYMWCKYDITVTFTSLISCDRVCCICGEAWSSRWLMMQLTNGQHACVLVFLPKVKILNIVTVNFFLCTWLTLCFTPHLMQWVIF